MPPKIYLVFQDIKYVHEFLSNPLPFEVTRGNQRYIHIQTRRKLQKWSDIPCILQLASNRCCYNAHWFLDKYIPVAGIQWLASVSKTAVFNSNDK